MTARENNMSEEINREVHEKVFGKCVHEYESVCLTPERPYYERLHRKTCTKCDYEGSFVEVMPDYSGSIADAWRVVEKMREVWAITLHEAAEGYFVMFCPKHRHINVDGLESVTDESLPTAICKAALAVVEK